MTNEIKMLLFGRSDHFMMSIFSFVLGGAFLVSFSWVFLVPSMWNFWLYLCMLCLVHEAEYLSVAKFHPNDVSTDAFLINHSREYTASVVMAVIEYLFEFSMFPTLKTTGWSLWMGAFIAFFGMGMRIAALFTGQSSFTHDVAETKEDMHVLVTTGCYSFVRHPGYCGWFWWNVGMQIMLLNPLCVAIYAFVYWKFFSERIPWEEELLVEFFGEEYRSYAQDCPSGIPAIP